MPDRAFEVDPRRAVFPARCAACGAPPTTVYRIEERSGLDLIVLWWGSVAEIEVPACGRCRARKLAGRVAWFGAIVAFVVGLCGLVALVFRVTESTAALGVALAVFIPLCVAVLWWARNREARTYHRLFSPVWTEAFDAQRWTVRLGFADERALRETMVLSGAADRALLATESDYRAHAAPAPTPFLPPDRRPAAWLLLVPAVLFALGGFAHFSDQSAAEARGAEADMHVVIAALHRLGGKWLVLATFEGAAALMVGGFFAVRSRGRRARAPR